MAKHFDFIFFNEYNLYKKENNRNSSFLNTATKGRVFGWFHKYDINFVVFWYFYVFLTWNYVAPNISLSLSLSLEVCIFLNFDLDTGYLKKKKKKEASEVSLFYLAVSYLVEKGLIQIPISTLTE